MAAGWQGLSREDDPFDAHSSRRLGIPGLKKRIFDHLLSAGGSGGARRLCIVIHNVDAPGLSNAEAQRTLAELAGTEHIHLACRRAPHTAAGEHAMQHAAAWEQERQPKC